jgi:hypothetical protein
VGVVAVVPLQPRWLVEAVAKVASSGFAEIIWGQTTISRGAERLFRHPGNGGLSPISRGTPPIWNLYRALDRKIFRSGQWSQRRDLATVLPEGRWDAPPQQVDVVIALGDVDDAAFARYAPCGVWRYWFGGHYSHSEDEAGIPEVLRGDEVTGSGIRVYRGGYGTRIAYESWSRTLPFSVARSRDNMFAKSSEFLVRALRDLHRQGPACLDAMQVVPEARPQAPVPDTGLMLARVARRAVEKATTVEQWSLAFRFVDIEPWNGSLQGFHRVAPPDDGFWADPFPLQRNGKNYIFFEELPGNAQRAHISVIEVDRAGRVSPARRVIERDYHLSYPFLVEEGGQLYMVPESAANRTIEIYRCIDFPHKWRRERVLLDHVFAADATLHREADRWWMFANLAVDGAEIHDELHVFTSDSLLGDWKPLARNPVKSDVRGARPAGRLFTQGGHLYRPSQICAPLYGSGIAVQRVLRLDDDYEEVEERRILPVAGEGVLGLHTMNRAGDLSVTDAFVRRPRFH